MGLFPFIPFKGSFLLGVGGGAAYPGLPFSPLSSISRKLGLNKEMLLTLCADTAALNQRLGPIWPPLIFSNICTTIHP